MAKLKRQKDSHEGANSSKVNDAKELTIIGNANNIDPELDALFASSFGPVVSPQKRFRGNSSPAQEDPAGRGPSPIGSNKDERGLLHRQSKALTEDAYSARLDETRLPQDGDILNAKTINSPDISKDKKLSRKRKRNSKEEVEDIYMKRLALEELRHEKLKREEEKAPQHEITTDVPKRDASSSSSTSTTSNPVREKLFEAEYSTRTLQHESMLSSESSLEIEKSSRTVFLGNVSIEAILSKSAKKVLINYLSSFLPSLPSQSPEKVMHQVESIRFRSTAFSSRLLPKKAAFAKKELMDATTKSTNAYAVYTTTIAAKEAIKRLNGTIVLGRHLRVDGVASPANTDPRRCVFVGNLSFVDDESAIDMGESDLPKVAPKKKKQPADVEEGLWRQFGKVGKVESVRVVRDATTRVGKGFAYVQFEDANAVEAALLLNDKKYPPLLPRKLRVTRARPITKRAQGPSSQNPNLSLRKANPNHTNIANTRQGVRNANTSTNKLLGRAGAAKARAPQEQTLRRFRDGNSTNTPEQFVFEGHRASSKVVGAGTKKRIAGGKAKAKGKPQTRSSRRGTAWKAAGSKKA